MKYIRVTYSRTMQHSYNLLVSDDVDISDELTQDLISDETDHYDPHWQTEYESNLVNIKCLSSEPMGEDVIEIGHI